MSIDKEQILNLSKIQKENLIADGNVEIFEILVEDKDPDIRQTLAAYGGKIPDNVCQKLLNDTNEEVRNEILMRLGILPDPESKNHDFLS